MNFSGYINADGFLTVEKFANPVPGEGNGWLQTGLAFICSPEAYGGESKKTIYEMLIESRHSPEVPLIWRSPHKRNPGDNQNHDDYWSALMLSYFTGKSWAKEIVKWGEATGWFFDIENPWQRRLRYFFGRFPDFAPFARLCAGQKLSMIDTLILAGSIVWDSFHISAADANMRAFCKLTVAERESLSCYLAARLWKFRVRKRYGMLGHSWREYFGANHPLVFFD